MKFIIDASDLDEQEIMELWEHHRNIIHAFLFRDEVDSVPQDAKAIIVKATALYTPNGTNIGQWITIGNTDQMKEVMKLEPPAEWELVVFSTPDWKIIPLENVIAKFQGSNLLVGAEGNSNEDIALLRQILEKGVDIAVIPGDVQRINEILEHYAPKTQHMTLQELEVISVEKVGMADRVCVDTCSLLVKGEGLLVGNTSKLFALIEAEVTESGYVSARPFRVNAGAIAAYVLGTEKTAYLSELKAGSKVMVVSKNGSIREETVCRVKIERRPMVLVQLKFGNLNAPIIVQDAETVRFVTAEQSVSVSELKQGMKVLGLVKEKGRHFGMEVEEFIEER